MPGVQFGSDTEGWARPAVIPLEPIALWHEFSPVVGTNRHGRRAVATCSRGRSRPEDNPPQDAVAVEHGGDARFDDHHGDHLARVLPADGALAVGELDIAAPVEATRVDLPLGVSSRAYGRGKRGRQTAACHNCVRDTRFRHTDNIAHSAGGVPEYQLDNLWCHRR